MFANTGPGRAAAGTARAPLTLRPARTPVNQSGKRFLIFIGRSLRSSAKAQVDHCFLASWTWEASQDCPPGLCNFHFGEVSTGLRRQAGRSESPPTALSRRKSFSHENFMTAMNGIGIKVPGQRHDRGLGRSRGLPGLAVRA